MSSLEITAEEGSLSWDAGNTNLRQARNKQPLQLQAPLTRDIENEYNQLQAAGAIGTRTGTSVAPGADGLHLQSVFVGMLLAFVMLLGGRLLQRRRERAERGKKLLFLQI